jgi:hypothetical protein
MTAPKGEGPNYPRPADERVYYLPTRELLDVTPELIAAILDQLPPHLEGQFAITVKGESLRRLLQASGATVKDQHDHQGEEQS